MPPDDLFRPPLIASIRLNRIAKGSAPPSSTDYRIFQHRHWSCEQYLP